jgi:hypothetical protein
MSLAVSDVEPGAHPDKRIKLSPKAMEIVVFDLGIFSLSFSIQL